MLRFSCIALAVLLCAPLFARTVEAPPVVAQTVDALPLAVQQETVLVVGQRPGPGMWKVSKGEHVLWVFATYSPLPVKMQWRSQQVEAIIARSQRYLSPPTLGAKVGCGAA